MGLWKGCTQKELIEYWIDNGKDVIEAIKTAAMLWPSHPEHPEWIDLSDTDINDFIEYERMK